MALFSAVCVFAYGLEAEAVESQAASAALQKQTKKPRAGRDFLWTLWCQQQGGA